VLAKIPEASVLEIYAQQAAGWLRIEPEALLRDVQALRSGAAPVRHSAPKTVPNPATAARSNPATKDESYLLGLVIGRPDLVARLSTELGQPEFSSPIYQGIFTRLEKMARADPPARPLEHLAEFLPEEQPLLAGAALAEYPELDSGEAALGQSLMQCFQTLKINGYRRRLRKLEGAADRSAERRRGPERRAPRPELSL